MVKKLEVRVKKNTKRAIDDFIDEVKQSKFFHYRCRIENEEIHLYLRTGYHAVGSVGHWFLDLASIDIAQPGRGLFSEILQYCQAVTPYDGIFVECIVNERLMRHMKKLQKQDPRWVQCSESFAWLKPPCADPQKAESK
jgi:hypothetical protein